MFDNVIMIGKSKRIKWFLGYGKRIIKENWYLIIVKMYRRFIQLTRFMLQGNAHERHIEKVISYKGLF